MVHFQHSGVLQTITKKHENLVSIELISVKKDKKITKLVFQALVLRQSDCYANNRRSFSINDEKGNDNATN